MSDEHPPVQPEPAPPRPAPGPVVPDDAGSQALAEALRSSFAIVKFAMLLMVLAFFSSGFFTVNPQEKAVILRFGKLVGEGQKALLSAGRLYWSYPYPIDEVIKIPITEIQQVSSTVGWYYLTPEQALSGSEPPVGPSLNPAMDSYAITADRNIIHTRATLYYQVDDPIRYVFSFASASNALQNALDNALLYTAAHYRVDDVLYNDVFGFQDAVSRRVADLMEQQRLGIVINQCVVQSIPPRQLKDIFAQVTTARENRNKALLDADSYKNQVLSQADAQSSTITNEAISARARYVESLKADATAFSALLPNYRVNPALFEQQKLLEVMGGVLTNVQDKIFLPERADGKARELRLMLNRELPKLPKTTTQP
jgi:membrane protease subunit HflK